MLSVHFNKPADYAALQVGIGNTRLTQALEKLSSGYRINRASDDAAGLAISEKLRAQVRGLTQAATNIQTAVSLVQAADDGISGLTEILQRMRELAIQSASGNLTNSDRNLMQVEVDQLLNEINRIMTSVSFNTIKLLDGTLSSLAPGSPKNLTPDMVKAGNSRFTVKDYNTAKVLGGPPAGIQLPSGSTYAGSILFQVGSDVGQFVKVQISTISVEALGLTSLFSSAPAVIGAFFTKPLTEGVPQLPSSVANADRVKAKGILTQAFAQSAIVALDSALSDVSRRRARLGAVRNELERRYDLAGSLREEIQAAESRIRDTDMAAEVVNFTQQQVVVQAATAMLAQSNLQTSLILQLLG